MLIDCGTVILTYFPLYCIFDITVKQQAWKYICDCDVMYDEIIKPQFQNYC